MCAGGNGKDIFGDAWWLDTDGQAFPVQGLAVGSEASWQLQGPRRAGSMSTLSMVSGLTGMTEDFRQAPMTTPQCPY